MEHKRKCVGCGELKSRNELIKITKEHKSGDIVIAPNSKTFGRSVYLCYNQRCINDAFKKNRLNKSLKTNKDVKGLLNEQYKS
ncbi:YlxR family protein [bacterium]|nr:YlxR family protein [bacterium]